MEVPTVTDPTHRSKAEGFAAAEDAVARYTLEDWAERFLKVIQSHRAAHKVWNDPYCTGISSTRSLEDANRILQIEERPFLLLCHSTGGLVVKQVVQWTPYTSARRLTDKIIGAEQTTSRRRPDFSRHLCMRGVLWYR